MLQQKSPSWPSGEGSINTKIKRRTRICQNCTHLRKRRQAKKIKESSRAQAALPFIAHAQSPNNRN
jgi:hypothetical protein